MTGAPAKPWREPPPCGCHSQAEQGVGRGKDPAGRLVVQDAAQPVLDETAAVGWGVSLAAQPHGGGSRQGLAGAPVIQIPEPSVDNPASRRHAVLNMKPNHRRVLQAVLYETFAIAFVVPVQRVVFVKPAASTFGLLAFFFIYAIVFTWPFDRVFGLPESATKQAEA